MKSTRFKLILVHYCTFNGCSIVIMSGECLSQSKIMLLHFQRISYRDHLASFLTIEIWPLEKKDIVVVMLVDNNKCDVAGICVSYGVVTAL